MALRVYLFGLVQISAGVYPYTFDAYLGTTEGPFIETPQERFRKRARFRQHLLGSAYLSEFVQGLLECGVSVIRNTCENLIGVRRGEEKGCSGTHTIQILDEPRQVLVL